MSRVSGKPYFVYLLWSTSKRKFYIGIREEPAERCMERCAAAVPRLEMLR